MLAGRLSMADDLLFPSKAGTVIGPNNLVHYQFLPWLEHAGLRRFRFHDLRHTFGSLLIQDGASLAHVKEQMGHSSIQITVDTYGHLIPGANINWIDGLDRKTSPQQNATPAQLEVLQEEPESLEVVDRVGERGRNRTYNLLIKSHKTIPANQQDSSPTPADSGKVLQNPQPPRNQEQADPPTNPIKGKIRPKKRPSRGDNGGYPHA